MFTVPKNYSDIKVIYITILSPSALLVHCSGYEYYAVVFADMTINDDQ